MAAPKLDLEKILGASDARSLLEHRCRVSANSLYKPTADSVTQIFQGSDRPTRVLGSLQNLMNAGR
jgi:hypothetical protein